MFRDQYQDGKHVQLLSVADKTSINKWTVQGSLKKAFDKSVKGYVYITDVGTKLSLPSSRRDELALLQGTVLLQCKLLDKKSFQLEVLFTDTSGVKRRIYYSGATHFTYSKNNIHKAPLNARIPSSMLLEGVWLNLQFDILSFITNCFSDCQFRQIDGIAVTGALLLKRIATYKIEIPDSLQYVIEKEFGEKAANDYEQYVL